MFHTNLAFYLVIFYHLVGHPWAWAKFEPLKIAKPPSPDANLSTVPSPDKPTEIPFVDVPCLEFQKTLTGNSLKTKYLAQILGGKMISSYPKKTQNNKWN